VTRRWKITLAFLGTSILAGLLAFPSLLRSVLRLQSAAATEERARREIVQPPISTPTDTREKAKLFWVSSTSPAELEPSEVELSLSADPVQRAKQLIAALMSQAPSPAQRTLPADALLLQFYLLPDGAAVADFSEALGTATPSGILSEQMTVDSIVRTLAANLTAVHQLKILIRGQEAETLAGHLDLTAFFPVALPEPAAAPAAPSESAPASPATGVGAATALPSAAP
jgi:Sporulation and spore germination